MDLMTLAAKIVLDDSQFNKGVQSAEKAGTALAQKMSAATVAVGNIAADMVKKGFGAIKGVVDGALDGYADYQQLIGGVETLFKQSTSKVAKYAKDSYRTTGLSANQYMETVTGFSASLLQGLDGDTEAAADLANTAITDMADNANKMGTDIGSIQTAYQGFAKKNYTMLDNLKLGYGGTQDEMVRLINDSGILDKKIKNLDGITFDQIIAAIHEVQTEMGITGTTAAEAAETISGSKASLAAAWSDLLSAIGGEGGEDRMQETLENFKTAFSTYMDNFIPTLSETIVNSGSLVGAIADAIASLPTSLLTELTEGGLDAGIEMIGAVGKITDWVIDSITEAFSGTGVSEEQVGAFGAALGEFIGSSIQKLVTNAPKIFFGMMELGVHLAGGLISGLTQGLFGENSEVDQISQKLSDTLYSAEVDSTRAEAIIGYLESLIKKYGETATKTGEWQHAVDELDKVLPGAGKTVENFGTDVYSAVRRLKQMNDEMRNTAVMNALTKATEDEFELLTRQKLEYNKNQYARNQAEYEMADYQRALPQMVADAAKNRMKILEEDRKNGGYFDPSNYAKLQQYANGLDDAGNKLESLDFDALLALLNTVGSKEEIEAAKALVENYNNANETMKAAQENMDKMAGEIETTEKALEGTRAAIVTTAEQMLGKGTESADMIGMAGDKVATMFELIATRLSEIRIPTDVGGVTYVPKATGLDYVPFNGYRAELHKGERIVPAAEAQRERNGSGMDANAIAAAVQQGIRAGMEGVGFYFDREQVAAAVTDAVSRNIAGGVSAWRY